MLYLGTDPGTPAIGDVRVRFQVVPPGDLSLVAEQTGDTFMNFTTPSGGDIDLLEDAFLLALAGSLTTIAITWVYYRPLIGIPLLIVAVAALVYSVLKIKRAPPATTPAAATA